MQRLSVERMLEFIISERASGSLRNENILGLKALGRSDAADGDE
jgi:hypothetical protein